MKLLLSDIKTLPPEIQYQIWMKRQRDEAFQGWLSAILCLGMTVTITVPSVNAWLDKLIPVGSVPSLAKPRSSSVDRARLVRVAKSMYGMNTAHGPDGGLNACAWWVNGHVIRQTTGGTLGNNPNWVPDILNDLERGYGTEVPHSQAQPGDIVIFLNERHGHIGIVIEPGVVLSTSSRGWRGPGVWWRSNLDFDGYYGGRSTGAKYGGDTRIFRLERVRR